MQIDNLKMHNNIITWLGVIALSMVLAHPASAASDVSNSPSTSNRATGSIAASIASSQTSSIISSAATGGFTSGGTGGFNTGGSGGFSAPSGSGGFNNGGGAPATPDKGVNLLNGLNGRSAGSGDNPDAIWVQGLLASIRRTETDLSLNGTVLNALAGYDRRFKDIYLAGLAVGFEQDKIKTKYNQGYFNSNAYTISPYASITLTPKWTIDGSVGYSYLNFNTASNGNSVSGSFDGGRWFASSNLTGAFTEGNWRFQPRLGVSVTREIQNSYTDSTGGAVDSTSFTLGNVTGGGKAGYDFDGIVPYAKVLGEWDFKHPEAVLKANGEMSQVSTGGGTAGLGVEVSKNQMTGSLEVDNNSLLRQDTNVWSVIGRFRIEF